MAFTGRIRARYSARGTRGRRTASLFLASFRSTLALLYLWIQGFPQNSKYKMIKERRKLKNVMGKRHEKKAEDSFFPLKTTETFSGSREKA